MNEVLGGEPTASREPTTHEAALALAQEAALQVTAWQARLVEATREVLRFPTPDGWRPYLAWALGLTSSESGELLELVDRLEELPLTAQLLVTGERSLRTVLAIARRATPENEAALIEATREYSGAQLERVLREYDRVLAPSAREGHDDELVDDEPDPVPSTARWGWRNGRFHLDADFDGADGAALQAWLEAERDRIREEGTVGEITGMPPVHRDSAEALLALGERAVSTKATSVGFLPDNALVNVLVHAHEGPDGLEIDRAFVPGAGPVPAWWAAMMAEQGPVTTTLMLRGEPVLATSPTRLATADQRRALLARDGGCAYPGCGAVRRLIAHHIRYYDDGGPTELRNLVLLCRRHHRIVHRCALRIEPAEPSTTDRYLWRFLQPSGRELRPERPWPPPRRRTPVAERRRGAGDRLTHYAMGVTIEHLLDVA